MANILPDPNQGGVPQAGLDTGRGRGRALQAQRPLRGRPRLRVTEGGGRSRRSCAARRSRTR